ncbi:MAG: GNAT family N-acetyltransferase [Clostridium sp.]|nr:GNAT family N-acetyltransferase [Clostridium sp.]
MKIEIKDIRKKDHKKAIQFAIKGMHFDWYLDNKFLLNAYGRYFWYLEINRATQILAAYADGEFAGVLLAEIKSEEKKYQSFLQKSYIKIVDVIQRTFFKGGADLYEDTTKELLAHYLKSNTPDGEILFLAADPDCKIKGIGTALLNALEEKEKGKTLYLYTDDACTYQFYEHRGFERAEEKEIILKMPKGRVPLKCFVYSKTV